MWAFNLVLGIASNLFLKSQNGNVQTCKADSLQDRFLLFQKEMQRAKRTSKLGMKTKAEKSQAEKIELRKEFIQRLHSYIGTVRGAASNGS
jgi:hypothetical protein